LEIYLSQEEDKLLDFVFKNPENEDENSFDLNGLVAFLKRKDNIGKQIHLITDSNLLETKELIADLVKVFVEMKINVYDLLLNEDNDQDGLITIQKFMEVMRKFNLTFTQLDTRMFVLRYDTFKRTEVNLVLFGIDWY
jgi:hypothetical protein